jgi:hypothetical protein
MASPLFKELAFILIESKGSLNGHPNSRCLNGHESRTKLSLVELPRIIRESLANLHPSHNCITIERAMKMTKLNRTMAAECAHKIHLVKAIINDRASRGTKHALAVVVIVAVALNKLIELRLCNLETSNELLEKLDVLLIRERIKEAGIKMNVRSTLTVNRRASVAKNGINLADKLEALFRHRKRRRNKLATIIDTAIRDNLPIIHRVMVVTNAHDVEIKTHLRCSGLEVIRNNVGVAAKALEFDFDSKLGGHGQVPFSDLIGTIYQTFKKKQEVF